MVGSLGGYNVIVMMHHVKGRGMDECLGGWMGGWMDWWVDG